ncbi:MAG: hypothetical protein JW967_07760 [Dehalococcoidales bacterium]|nr:hypothetical protein [Dehalococcoidales bacterium]
MFGISKKEQQNSKLPGPRELSEPVKKYLTSTQIIEPSTVPFLKATVKTNGKGNNVYNIFLFDPADAEARGIRVQNYDTLKEHPEMVVAEGWLNETEKTVELTPKHPVTKITFLTYEEILRRIEELKEPDSSVFFYTNAGSGTGGPLGRGAALIKLNAPVNGKKVKKYSVYGVNVVDMQPVRDDNKAFDSNKAVEIAKWVAQAHKPRFC